MKHGLRKWPILSAMDSTAADLSIAPAMSWPGIKNGVRHNLSGNPILMSGLTNLNPWPSCIRVFFFDLRTIHGDKSLLKDIRTRVLKKTRKNTLFLGLLIQNALKLRPPLGFFRDFVLVDDGEHKRHA